LSEKLPQILQTACTLNALTAPLFSGSHGIQQIFLPVKVVPALVIAALPEISGFHRFRKIYQTGLSSCSITMTLKVQIY